MSVLFSATTKGTLRLSKIFKLSLVWGWNPLFASTTKIAISAAEPPRERKFVKIS